MDMHVKEMRLNALDKAFEEAVKEAYKKRFSTDTSVWLSDRDVGEYINEFETFYAKEEREIGIMHPAGEPSKED